MQGVLISRIYAEIKNLQNSAMDAEYLEESIRHASITASVDTLDVTGRHG